MDFKQLDKTFSHPTMNYHFFSNYQKRNLYTKISLLSNLRVVKMRWKVLQVRIYHLKWIHQIDQQMTTNKMIYFWMKTMMTTIMKVNWKMRKMGWINPLKSLKSIATARRIADMNSVSKCGSTSIIIAERLTIILAATIWTFCQLITVTQKSNKLHYPINRNPFHFDRKSLCSSISSLNRSYRITINSHNFPTVMSILH